MNTRTSMIESIELLMLLVLGEGALTFAWGGCKNTDPCNITCACPFGGLEVKGSGNVTVNSDNCNSMQNKNEFKKLPQLKMEGAHSSKSYALFMLDPDVPSYPPGNFYNHLVLSNIPGVDFKEGCLKNSTTTLCYNGPDPPQSTGTHRYMFLVYEQDKANSVLSEIPDNRRGNWSLSCYLKEQSSVKLCGPVAGTQFRTKS